MHPQKAVEEAIRHFKVSAESGKGFEAEDFYGWITSELPSGALFDLP
jgi:hypothetical protein